MGPWAIGSILGGVSLAGNVFGSIAGNKRRRRAERMIEQQKKELDDWRNNEIHQDYLDRADSQALLRNVSEQNREAMKAMNTDAVRSGATEEAKVAAAGKLNKNYATAASQVAAAGAQHKDRVNQQWRSERHGLDNLKISNMMDTSDIDSITNAIGDATGIIAGLWASGAGGKNKVDKNTQRWVADNTSKVDSFLKF